MNYALLVEVEKYTQDQELWESILASSSDVSTALVQMEEALEIVNRIKSLVSKAKTSGKKILDRVRWGSDADLMRTLTDNLNELNRRIAQKQLNTGRIEKIPTAVARRAAKELFTQYNMLLNEFQGNHFAAATTLFTAANLFLWIPGLGAPSALLSLSLMKALIKKVQGQEPIKSPEDLISALEKAQEREIDAGWDDPTWLSTDPVQ